MLGGGLVPGSVVLFGGDPGIGKSTLLLQMAGRLAAAGHRTLYVTGEESTSQVRGRAERVGAVVDGLGLLATTDLLTAVGAIGEQAPALAVVDSVQTLASDELGGPAGSVGQVREVAARLTEIAKAGDTAIALVGHVTKEGTVAGPRTLEHLVDAVIYLEGERLGSTRLVRAAKNRFGSTDEVGVLEMRGDGLAEVPDASRFFLESEQPPVAGSAITIALEGTRPLAVEIQALVAPSGYGSPRRATTGVDVNRVLMLIAVLARHAGLNLTGHDVYVNVAGGLRIEEPAADLAVAMALASSLRERPVQSGTVLAGELSLAGRLRPAMRADRRWHGGAAARVRSADHRSDARCQRERRPELPRRWTFARPCAWPLARPDRPLPGLWARAKVLAPGDPGRGTFILHPSAAIRPQFISVSSGP